MLTIGRLAHQFNLSRSTLLYYDRIDLLRPSGRSESGYRLYSQGDVERLKSICAYRDAGLSLEDIGAIINNLGSPQRKVLENRLKDINLNIQTLQQQQRVLAGLLKLKARGGPQTTTGKQLWVEMFRAAGMDEVAMHRWHQEFELRAPDDHHQFLLSLEISEKEAIQIRKLSANMATNEEEMNYFFQLYEEVELYAPSTKENTVRALRSVPNLPEAPRILDIGCGCGAQTLTLAETLDGGEIIAVDNHQPFLDKLSAKAVLADLSTKVTVQLASMSELPFAPQSFDLIWAEGSIYIIGFSQGLEQWKPLLKAGGTIVLTDMIWLQDNPPKEIVQYWTINNPGITNLAQRLEEAENAGYKIINHFTLPKQAWKNYYAPLHRRIAQLRAELAWNETAEKVFAQTEEEALMYDRYGDWYGYEFFLLQTV